MDPYKITSIAIFVAILGAIIGRIVHWSFFDAYGKRSCLRLIHTYRINDGTLNIHAFKLRRNPSRQQLDESMRLANQRFASDQDLRRIALYQFLTPDVIIATEIAEGVCCWIKTGKTYSEHVVTVERADLLKIGEQILVATLDQEFYRRRDS